MKIYRVRFHVMGNRITFDNKIQTKDISKQFWDQLSFDENGIAKIKAVGFKGMAVFAHESDHLRQYLKSISLYELASLLNEV